MPGGSAGSTTADAQTAATDSAGVWIGLVEPTHGRDEPADDPALDEQAEHNEQAEHADDNARAS
ncbi:MAG: hypothetical protein KatS3mg103_1327 [Phycisphaerales bacterium]|nr:MAG: hypothetical protein KatS3mg103_1327 [Phycisphaerales bacterium]